MATLIATPIANAAAGDYKINEPTKSWSTNIKAVGDAPFDLNYIQGAATDGVIYTLPATVSDDYMALTYYTLGKLLGPSNRVEEWSAGGPSGFVYEKSTVTTEGMYSYAGTAIATDDAGTLYTKSVKSRNAPGALRWSDPIGGITYWVDRAYSGYPGTKSGVALSSLINRCDFMSANGDGINSTGYLWFTPQNTANVTRVTITKGSFGAPTNFTGPVSSNGSRAWVKEYSKGKLLYNPSLSNTTGKLYRGTYTEGSTAVSWTDLGLTVHRHGSAAFIIGDHEIIAYSKSTTTIALYDYTDKKEITTFTPFTTTSIQSYVSHSIDAKVNGNTADLYIYVPGVGGARYTITASAITNPVTSLKATLSNAATNSVTVSWAKPSAGIPTKYQVQYSSNGGSSWSTAIETTNLNYTYPNLAAGNYTFRVRPYYGGSSTWGEPATSNSVEIVDVVTNLKVSRQCYGEGGNSVMGTVDALVTWTGVTGKEYKVYYQTMRRDESGNRVADNGDAWVELGTTTITSGTEGSYTHKNIQPGDGYDRIYNYKVAPYYSGTVGQETIIEGKGKTITAFYQSVPVDVALTQPTEERDGKKFYTFNLQLDIALNDNFSASRLDDNDAMADAYRYVIVVDETAAKWLNAATNASEVGTFVQGPVTVVANNCYHYSVDGWYLEVDIEDLKPTDDLSKGTKSLTWRNVNPGIVYQPQVYAISSRAFNFTNATATLANEPGAEAGKMVVPAPKWTLPNGNNVGITAVAGDFSSFVSNDHYPMGTFQKKGDITTPTHPITISEANTIGTIGATIEPIAIADEVIGTKNADGSYENWTWEIAYTFNLFEKNGDEWVCIRNSQKYGQISSDLETSSMYSNSQDLAFDLVGIPVGIEETTSPDGRSRLVYKPENNKEYKVVVETNYRRGAGDTRIHVVGVSETLITLNPDFETPEIDEYKCPGYLFLEQSTHWDEGNKDDEGNYINGGYYKHYYDAVMNITLKEFQEPYVKYLGYYANPSFTCIGHPTATSNKWTPYQAASILIDEHVVLYNKRNPSFALKQLGYTGSEDWSKLITKSGTFPLKVHYVWAGNEKINAVEDAEFEFELSANYPILVASTPEFRINKSLIDNKHELAPANPLSRATNYTLQMITAVNKDYKTLVMDDVVETQLTTGVEAVAFGKGVLMVYPNPAQSEATIRSTTVLGEVKIFTIDGQLVKEFESGETTAKFNVSDLTSGVYVVSASGTTTRMIKK